MAKANFKLNQRVNRVVGHLEWLRRNCSASQEDRTMKTTLPAPTKANCWFLENKDVRIAVDKKTGLVRSAYCLKAKVDLFGQLFPAGRVKCKKRRADV